MNGSRDLPSVGWREWLALPELGIPRIKVKVDTGARTSAIQSENVERFRSGGVDRVRFIVHPLQRDESVAVRIEADLLDMRSVRSSSGVAEERPTIRTRVVMGAVEWEIELTLARRVPMRFRMLLGRTAIRNRFLVDPGRSYLVGTRP